MQGFQPNNLVITNKMQNEVGTRKVVKIGAEFSEAERVVSRWVIA
jgi:hypothetical protein